MLALLAPLVFDLTRFWINSGAAVIALIQKPVASFFDGKVGKPKGHGGIRDQCSRQISRFLNTEGTSSNPRANKVIHFKIQTCQ